MDRAAIIILSACQLTPQRHKITILVVTTHLFEKKKAVLAYADFKVYISQIYSVKFLLYFYLKVEAL